VLESDIERAAIWVEHWWLNGAEQDECENVTVNERPINNATGRLVAAVWGDCGLKQRAEVVLSEANYIKWRLEGHFGWLLVALCGRPVREREMSPMSIGRATGQQQLRMGQLLLSISIGCA